MVAAIAAAVVSAPDKAAPVASKAAEVVKVVEAIVLAEVEAVAVPMAAAFAVVVDRKWIHAGASHL